MARWPRKTFFTYAEADLVIINNATLIYVYPNTIETCQQPILQNMFNTQLFVIWQTAIIIF